MKIRIKSLFQNEPLPIMINNQKNSSREWTAVMHYKNNRSKSTNQYRCSQGWFNISVLETVCSYKALRVHQQLLFLS